MKKGLFVILFISICIFMSFAEDQNLVIINSGKEFSKDVKGAKLISFYITFDKTKMWNDELDVDKYLADRKNKGKNAKEDKEKMIAKFYKTFGDRAKLFGKKWGMNRVENIADVKDGYIVVLNYDKIIPIPGIGSKGFASFVIYSSKDIKKELIKGEIKAISLAKSFADFVPENQFSEMAQRFVMEFINYLNEK
jgi:hypothetical protein